MPSRFSNLHNVQTISICLPIASKNVFSVLGENIVDSYMSIAIGKDMWDALEAKFGVSDAGSELYVMEQL